MSKPRVAVLFGSRSVEHEVSIVTAMQIFANIDRSKYDVIPIYIDKQGSWLMGVGLDNLDNYKNLELVNRNQLTEYRMPSKFGTHEISAVKVGLFGSKSEKIDIVIPAIHGTFGEDGTLQGLLEMAGIPYTGSGVGASALGMDKVAQKSVYAKEGLPVVRYLWFYDHEWEADSKTITAQVERQLGYPVCVKPANLGSSVGISMAKNRKEFTYAVSVASSFDSKLLIEECLVGIDEINVSVMGNSKLEVSVCEQPVKSESFLTYADKYLKGGKTKGMASLSRLVPAPIGASLASTIQDYGKRAFRSLGCSGLARIDFLVNLKKQQVYINEINTLPGSMSFYLWEKSGYSFPQLLDRLIELGFERYSRKSSKLYSIDSKLLQTGSGSGSKVQK